MAKVRIKVVQKTISQTIIETFDTMLAMELVRVDKVTDPQLNEERLVGAVHYAGEVQGVMSLHMGRAFARTATMAMLGLEESELHGDEEVKDVLGELTNIISGNLKTDFTDMGLACILSTPSITHGSDFKIEPNKIGPIHQWVFRHKKNEVVIEISLKEDISGRGDVEGIDTLSSDEIREKIKKVDVPNTVVNAVIDVFYTMLEMEIEKIDEVPQNFREEKRTVGTVSFAGDVDGIFIIQVNDAFAYKMSAAMLGVEEDEIEEEEEVFDVMREMSNIIGGNLKSTFVDVGLHCVLSTPSVTNGLDFRVEVLNVIGTERFLFTCNGHTVIVDAGIKKDDYEENEEEDASTKSDFKVVAKGVEEADELRNLQLLMQIPLNLTVELGRSKKRLNDLLKMGHGSVVELEQLEDEPVEILVNDTLIAKGEVLVEKEKYGIRILEVVSREQRVKSLS